MTLGNDVGSQVVSVLACYSDDLSSHPEVYIVYLVKIVWK